MLGSWVRAPASSPDDCRNAVVFFLSSHLSFVAQLRCLINMVWAFVCKHSLQTIFITICRHIRHKTTKQNSLDAMFAGLPREYFPHRASATNGTPSVTAKAVRAPASSPGDCRNAVVFFCHFIWILKNNSVLLYGRVTLRAARTGLTPPA